MARWLSGRFFTLAGFVIGENHSSATGRIFNVFNADGDTGFDDLFHCKRVDDFGTIVCELSGFFRSDDGDELRGGNLARVGGEDAVNFFPDLKLVGVNADCEEGSTEVSVPAPDGGEEGAGNDAEVASYYRDAVFAG